LPATDLSLLIDAARSAGAIALDHWKTDLQVDHKHGGSPVSEADYAVDSHLRETLTAARPDYGWLSEETPDTLERLSRDTVFIADPIDGTRAYLNHEPTWAIALAVVHKGQPTAGVVYLPARDKLYAATLDGGATLNDAPLRTGSRTDPDGASVLAPRPSLDPKWWSCKVPRFDRHWRPSLAYRFCLVAQGRFDAMLTLRDAYEWDIASGILIAQEAGVKLTDRNARPITLNSRSAKAAGILAAPPALHRAIAKRLGG
jgi:myo-inositol-1(or 4)-monophosphatase